MAKFYAELTAELTDFIENQKIFFTATAPLEGRINLSPKGIDTFRCIDPKTVAYLDLTGSGNETSAHLCQNGRITLMFCSFTEQPLILRIYGYGRVISRLNDEWSKFYSIFHSTPGDRQIIIIDINSLQTSCGYGVPMYDLKQERKTLIEWAKRKGNPAIYQYWHDKNQTSIDGLPAEEFGVQS